MQKRPETAKTFEETYPQYPFSELVRLGTAVAKLIARRRRRAERSRAENKPGALPERGDAATLAAE